MRNVDFIIVHCADTYADMDTRAADIDRWHKDRGWDGIGYHYVICRDGKIEEGRPIEKPGAHAYNPGQGPGNGNSIGVCLIGGKARPGENAVNFTGEQWESLRVLCAKMEQQFPGAEIIGHCDVPNSGKTCPNFNVKAWREAR